MAICLRNIYEDFGIDLSYYPLPALYFGCLNKILKLTMGFCCVFRMYLYRLFTMVDNISTPLGLGYRTCDARLYFLSLSFIFEQVICKVAPVV